MVLSPLSSCQHDTIDALLPSKRSLKKILLVPIVSMNIPQCKFFWIVRMYKNLCKVFQTPVSHPPKPHLNNAEPQTQVSLIKGLPHDHFPFQFILLVSISFPQRNKENDFLYLQENCKLYYLISYLKRAGNVRSKIENFLLDRSPPILQQ